MPFGGYNEAAAAYGYDPRELAARSQGLRILNPATGQWQSRIAYERYRAGTGLDPGPLDYVKAVSDGLNGVANVINAVNNNGQGSVQPATYVMPTGPEIDGGNFFQDNQTVLILGGVALLAVIFMMG